MLSTEGRVFADQLLREVKRLEPVNADRLWPGCNSWMDAFGTMNEAMAKDGPIGRVRTLNAVFDRLDTVPKAERMFRGIFVGGSGKRSLLAVFGICMRSRHPFCLHDPKIDQIGLHSKLITILVTRKIMDAQAAPLAFMSWHALGRLAERGGGPQAREMFWQASLGSFLMRRAVASTDLNLVTGPVVLTGQMRPALAREQSYGHANATFYDITTALARSDLRDNDPRVVQGEALMQRVDRLVKERDPKVFEENTVPSIASRNDDFVSRLVPADRMPIFET
jgi:hypothetical protein